MSTGDKTRVYSCDTKQSIHKIGIPLPCHHKKDPNAQQNQSDADCLVTKTEISQWCSELHSDMAGKWKIFHNIVLAYSTHLM